METKKIDWSVILKDKSIIVNNEDVEMFCEFFASVGLFVNGGAILDNGQRVLYF